MTTTLYAVVREAEYGGRVLLSTWSDIGDAREQCRTLAAKLSPAEDDTTFVLALLVPDSGVGLVDAERFHGPAARTPFADAVEYAAAELAAGLDVDAVLGGMMYDPRWQSLSVQEMRRAVANGRNLNAGLTLCGD